jgi:uncharacterized membrane protein YfcA
MIEYLVLGIIAGILGGLLGIGGGSIIVPYLVYVQKLTQHQAQGISLLLVALPVGLLAALKYYKEGNLNLKFGLIIATGFFIGGHLGALLAHKIPDNFLKRLFGIYLLVIAIKMILGK